MKLEKYLNQDIDNPRYLFHGSPVIMDEVVPRQATDSLGNSNNEAEAVFLFPSFLKATPYAFKDSIKKLSEGSNWNFSISNTNTYPLMQMSGVIIDRNLIGYIYVFEKDNDMIKDEDSYQYKCFKSIKPVDIVKVIYKDFEDYFEVIEEKVK